MSELRPCPNPWCKQNDVAVHGPGMVSDTYCVGCECGIGGPECATESEAVTAWNHRPVEDALVKALKSVRRHLRECWHRETRGIECDIYMQEAQNVIKAALKLTKEGRNG
jgi:hypothetical protein